MSCLVPQVVYEYWVVATRPTADNGFGMASTDVNQAIDHWCDLFVLLRDERGIFSIWRDLVVSNNVSGKNDHDARLVAAMKRHDIRHLLTFNIADFQRYSEIERLDPREVAANRI